MTTTPLVDTLRELARSHASGLVTVRGVAGSGQVRLADGGIVEADAPAPSGRLGERLVGAGLLDPASLEAALDRQADAAGAGRIGSVLVDSGLIGAHVVALFVQEQLLDAVFELVGWTDATVEFAASPPQPTDGVPVHLRVEEALEEVDRRRREWDTIRRAVPGLAAVPRRNDTSSRSTSPDIEPDEQAVLENIDGRATIGEIADRLGYGAFDAARVVYALVRDGRVEVVATDGTVHDQVPARTGTPGAPVPPPLPAAPPRAGTGSVGPPPRGGSRPVDTAEVLRELSRIARGPQPDPEVRVSRRRPTPPEPPPAPDRLARRRRFARGD